VETRARLAVLQHAKDARRVSNTGRMLASLVRGAGLLPYGLPGEALDIGALAARPESAILFPKEEAAELSPRLFGAGAVPTLFLLDGTWSQGARLARRLMRAGGRVARLPPGPPGRYRLRRGGQPSRLCTFEAAFRALRALGEEEPAARLEACFGQWVERHLEFRARGGRPPPPSADF